MVSLIFLVAVLFSFIAFSTNRLPLEGLAPIYSFYLLVVQFVLSNLLIFGFGFGLLMLVISRKIKFEIGMNKMRRIMICGKQALIIVFTGLLMSSLMVFTIALVELNVLALLVNINPRTMGVRNDIAEIEEILKLKNTPVQIVIITPGNSQEIVTIAANSADKESVFSRDIIPSIPDFMVMPVANLRSNIILFDNTLIVNQKNLKELEMISPLVTSQLLKHRFPGKSFKPAPIILFADRREYNQYRRADLDKKLKKMDEELISFENQIELLEAQNELNKEGISEKEEALNKVYRQREAEYQKCFSTQKSEVKCKQEILAWDEKIIQASGEVKNAVKKTEDDKKQLIELGDFLKVIQAQQSVLKVLENNIVQEFGQFVPPDAIYLTTEELEKKSTVDYFETLTHEYLHYESYISDKRVLADAFWEEGLTEYFARNAIKKGLNADTNIGYPAAVKIIRQVAKRIPESELAEIYFTKDQTKLKESLDLVYGDNFYNNSRILFTLIQYTSDPTQIVKYANSIMEKIGGNPLTLEDVMSN